MREELKKKAPPQAISHNAENDQLKTALRKFEERCETLTKEKAGLSQQKDASDQGLKHTTVQLQEQDRHLKAQATTIANLEKQVVELSARVAQGASSVVTDR